MRQQKKQDEPLWCKLYREQVLKPEQRQRITEQIGRTKESQAGFYNSREWKMLRAEHIRNNPLCVECERQERIRPAQVVDHIKPIDECPELANDPDNLQSLCNYHHIRKTNADKVRQNKEKRLAVGRELMKKFETKFNPGGG